MFMFCVTDIRRLRPGSESMLYLWGETDFYDLAKKHFDANPPEKGTEEVVIDFESKNARVTVKLDWRV